jgi:hypothetical protein
MIILEAVYSKKLGLPNYSSHRYSVSIRTEIPDIGAVEKTNKEMYQLLQSAVDAEITKPGFVPESSFGIDEQAPVPATNGHTNGNGNWACSDKQKELILKLTKQQCLTKEQVEAAAQERFGKGVKQLNKLEASGLIADLMEPSDSDQPKVHMNGSGHRRYSRT